LLHVFYARSDRTLHGAWSFLARSCRAVDISKLLLETRHLPDAPNRFVARVARDLLERESREREGVLAMARSCLAIFGNDVGKATTAWSLCSSEQLEGVGI
jgi:type IV secretory pathway TraG/TraD family ATPase VirD4